MRGFAVVLCLCAVAASARTRKVTPVVPVQEVEAQAADPCAGVRRTRVAALDMDAALRQVAESQPAAEAEAPDTRQTANLDPVKLASGMAWEEAANELLDLADSIQRLTPEQRETLAAIEQGKTAQQIFSGRLALLKMITRR